MITNCYAPEHVFAVAPITGRPLSSTTLRCESSVANPMQKQQRRQGAMESDTRSRQRNVKYTHQSVFYDIYANRMRDVSKGKRLQQI